MPNGVLIGGDNVTCDLSKFSFQAAEKYFYVCYIYLIISWITMTLFSAVDNGSSRERLIPGFFFFFPSPFSSVTQSSIRLVVDLFQIPNLLNHLLLICLWICMRAHYIYISLYSLIYIIVYCTYFFVEEKPSRTEKSRHASRWRGTVKIT